MRDKEYISASSLNMFDISPLMYRKYKDRELIRSKSKAMDFGTAVHKYLLEPKKFFDEYVKIPMMGLSGKTEEFVRALGNMDIDLDDIEAIKELGLLSRGVEKTLDTYKGTIQRMREAKGKYILSEEESNMLVKIGSQVYHHKEMSTLLDEKEGDLTEFTYTWEDSYGLGWKIIIDRARIDVLQKKVIIVDVKTSESISQFYKNFELHKYYRQLALYKLGIENYLYGYEVVPYIAVIQTKFLNEVRLLKLSPESLHKGVIEILYASEDLEFHY